jgi:hypothetical protein
MRSLGLGVGLRLRTLFLGTSIHLTTGLDVDGRDGCRKATTHLQTPAALTLRLNFSSLFTPKSLGTMMDLDLSLDVVADKSVLKYSEGAELM